MGVNFGKTFLTIIKLIIFYIFFTIAIFYNLDMKQINIKTAFFYNMIDQFLYVKIPKKYE